MFFPFKEHIYADRLRKPPPTLTCDKKSMAFLNGATLVSSSRPCQEKKLEMSDQLEGLATQQKVDQSIASRIA
jgi:hypothetical protein